MSVHVTARVVCGCVWEGKEIQLINTHTSLKAKAAKVPNYKYAHGRCAGDTCGA